MCKLCRSPADHALRHAGELGPEDRQPQGADKPVFTEAQAVNQLLATVLDGSDQPWDRGSTVTWAFVDIRADLLPVHDGSVTHELENGALVETEIGPTGPQFRAAMRTAFAVWDDTVPLTFQEVGDPSEADIQVVGLLDDLSTYAYALAPSPDAPKALVAFTLAGGEDATFADRDIPDRPQDLFRSYAFSTMIHEIGHALGLSHPGAYNGSGEYEDDAEFAQDTVQYTIMSYFEAFDYSGDHSLPNGSSAYGATPQYYDILAVERVYGRETVRTGASVYGFDVSPDVPAWLNFRINDRPVVSIRDSGGIDTLNLSALKGEITVDLRNARFSDTHGMTGNLFIAKGTQIENLRAGSGSDVLTGNLVGNRIEGGSGLDRLDGLGGNDTLLGGAGGDTLFGRQGRDVLILGPGNDTATGGPDRDIFDLGAIGQRPDRDTIIDMTADEVIRLRPSDPDSVFLEETAAGYLLLVDQAQITIRTRALLDEDNFAFL